MTLIERAHYRLTMLRIALRACAADVRRGFTIRPILGASDGTEGDSGGDGSGDGDGGSGDENGGKSQATSKASGAEGDSGDGDGGKFDEERARAEIRKKNNEAKNLRDRLKAAEEKASKYDQLEDAQKSESEKLNEKAAGLEKRATAAEMDAARLRVALNQGLTGKEALALAKRLVGETDAELEADAEELLESFKPKGEKSGEESQEGKQSESPKGGRERTGATGDTEPEETDPRKLAEGLPSYS